LNRPNQRLFGHIRTVVLTRHEWTSYEQMVLELKAEISNGKMDKAMLIRFQVMPSDQEIEQNNDEGKAGADKGQDTMRERLEMTNRGQHGQDGFNQHTGIPVTAFADFQIGGRPVLFVETGVAEDQHQVSYPINQSLKSGKTTIIHIGG